MSGRGVAFAAECKAGAVKLAPAGWSAPQVAVDLDHAETGLREGVRSAEADAGHGEPEALKTEERQEVAPSRPQNDAMCRGVDIETWTHDPRAVHEGPRGWGT